MIEQSGKDSKALDTPMATGQDFWTTERTSALDERLDPTLTAQREAFSGGRRKLVYLEGHAAIAQLNRLFGYGGWSYSVDQMGVDEYTAGPQEHWYAGSGRAAKRVRDGY